MEKILAPLVKIMESLTPYIRVTVCKPHSGGLCKLGLIVSAKRKSTLSTRPSSSSSSSSSSLLSGSKRGRSSSSSSTSTTPASKRAKKKKNSTPSSVLSVKVHHDRFKDDSYAADAKKQLYGKIVTVVNARIIILVAEEEDHVHSSVYTGILESPEFKNGTLTYHSL